ncbi:preprotein translocase subunit SecG [Lysobacter sp. A3-1-A15]|uniref:preprotein translocase subunit SecG n=1 Tax=Novilysobacter viscosus TaxID=3098602 RepID=UPI002ED8EAFD
MLLFLNVIYVLVAISMVALILMQRGAGAQAGSGFGGGASATVFGSRGASNFLSKATKWLAITFFAISLFMAWQATNRAAGVDAPAQDLGLMSEVPAVTAPAVDGPVPAQAPQAQPEVPRAPAQEVPAEVPAAPVEGGDTQ